MRWIPIGTILFRYSMSNRPMEEKLKEAVDRRITRENEFIEDLISQINKIILTLDECDPSNARTAIDLTQQQLSDIILKLDNVTNMTDRTASIVNIVKDNHLMRRPQSPHTVQPPPPPQVPVQTTQPQSQLTTQRPAPLPINPLQLQQPAQTRNLGTRTKLAPLSGGRRTRKRKGKY